MQRPDRIVVIKGVKLVALLTSAERVTLIFVRITINSTRNMISPIFIFPRKNYREYFDENCPSGGKGFANQYGCMNSNDFFIFLEHCFRYTR